MSEFRDGLMAAYQVCKDQKEAIQVEVDALIVVSKFTGLATVGKDIDSRYALISALNDARNAILDLVDDDFTKERRSILDLPEDEMEQDNE